MEMVFVELLFFSFLCSNKNKSKIFFLKKVIKKIIVKTLFDAMDDVGSNGKKIIQVLNTAILR